MMIRPVLLLTLLASVSATYTWDRKCGTQNDRLITTKFGVKGALSAGSKVTATASGTTNLHMPLVTGSWQVRVYETGEPHETYTDTGDLMKALKFDDPKNTTFTMTISFTLPKKKKTGEFIANIFATDQAHADYLCLDLNYNYTSALEVSESFVQGKEHCKSDKDCPSSYCQNPNPKTGGTCHLCGDACCQTDKDCPGSYCANDTTKIPPYFCHGKSTSLSTEASTEANTTGIVHIILHSPGDHCMEVRYPGGADSPFWKDEGWKYSPPKWSKGACNRTKWKSQDAAPQIGLDGYTQEKNAPYGAVVEYKYGIKLVQELGVEDVSVYCMKDPSKKPPYYCHVPPLPSTCKKDKDCVTPWYSSYCQNKASCHQELPPTCKTDKDCQAK